MLLAEEPEPRPLRLVLAAWVAAAHVTLDARSSSTTGSRTIALGSARKSGGDSVRKQLREAIHEQIKGVRRAPGHFAFMPKRHVERNYGCGPMSRLRVIDQLLNVLG